MAISLSNTNSYRRHDTQLYLSCPNFSRLESTKFVHVFRVDKNLFCRVVYSNTKIERKCNFLIDFQVGTLFIHHREDCIEIFILIPGLTFMSRKLTDTARLSDVERG